jgi:acyl-CoA reductase-like NAD-dependent aldehyde dehydrogenase
VSAWPEIVDHVGATWRPADITLDDWLDDPNSGEPLQRHAASAPGAMNDALHVAAEVHERGEWTRTSQSDRGGFLRAIADAVDSRAGEIARADAINSGVPVTVTRLMADDLSRRFHAAAEALLANASEEALGGPDRPVRLMRLPLGPALIMTAWNASTFVAASRVASALAAGCPVILKPSEWAPWGCQILSEQIAGTGLPPGVFQLLHGGPEQGAQLVRDPRVCVISFTGGQTAGRQIAQTAGAAFKTLQLELGGNNPVIICGDADPQSAASSLAAGMTRLNGQWCEGPGRIFVNDAMHDAFVSLLLDELGRMNVGHSLEPDTTFGPLAYRRHRDHLASQVASLRDAGGVVHQPLQMPARGYYMSPTVVTDATPAAAADELFGPVVTVHRTRCDDESLFLANHPASGLDAYVFGSDIEACMSLGSRIVAGEVRINGTHLTDLGAGSAQTFWDSAGIGGHVPPAAMVELFRGHRVVGVDDPTAVL